MVAYTMKMALLLIPILLLGTTQVFAQEKCEKFDQTLCEHLQNPEGRKIRVIVYAEENITSQLKNISELELSDTHQDKHLFQISIKDTRLKDLKEISELSYVKMPQEPAAQDTDTKQKQKRQTNEYESTLSTLTSILILLIMLLAITSSIIIWKVKK